MTQNSKQSQTKQKSVSDFHNSCNEKERKRNKLRILEKIIRTPVLEFL